MEGKIERKRGMDRKKTAIAQEYHSTGLDAHTLFRSTTSNEWIWHRKNNPLYYKLHFVNI